MSKVTKAMILAAGFGTRLRPLTDTAPKPLIPYNGKPMIETAISRLKAAGINEFVINAHHHAEQMEEYFQHRKGTEKITLIKEHEILGTGGALLNARELLESTENFFLYNADVDTDAKLLEMAEYHLQRKALITLALKKRDTSRYILADPEMNVIGRTEGDNEVLYRNGVVSQKFGFCGIHLISSAIFRLLKGSGNFDIIPEYMRLISEGSVICGYDIGSENWKDLGKLSSLNFQDTDIK